MGNRMCVYVYIHVIPFRFARMEKLNSTGELRDPPQTKRGKIECFKRTGKLNTLFFIVRSGGFYFIFKTRKQLFPGGS